MSTSTQSFVNNRVLKFQVGYLLAESKGYSSEIELQVPRLRIAEDLIVDFLKGVLRLSRTSRGILVQGTLHSSIPGTCSRCLEECPIPLDVSIEELFVYPPEPGAEFVVGEDCNLDLAPLLREETIIDMPMNILCRPDCAGLCPECGANRNEGPCECESEPIDPRMAALKAFKDKLAPKS